MAFGLLELVLKSFIYYLWYQAWLERRWSWQLRNSKALGKGSYIYMNISYERKNKLSWLMYSKLFFFHIYIYILCLIFFLYQGVDPVFRLNAFPTRWRNSILIPKNWSLLIKKNWLGVATYFCFIFKG